MRIVRKVSLAAITAASLTATASLNLHAAVPLSFDDALSQIVARGTDIAKQQAAVGTAGATKLGAEFTFVPGISLDAKQSRTGDFSSAPTTSKQYEAVADLNLFHWGADIAALRAANANEASQRFTLEDIRLKTEEQGVEALLGEIESIKEIGINQRIVEMQKKLMAIAHQRYHAGLLALQEVDKVEVDLENAQAGLADSKIKETSTRATLQTLLGSNDIVQKWPWKTKVEDALKSLPTIAKADLSQRPDLQAARLKRDAAQLRYTSSKRKLLPSVDGTFSYGYYSAPDVTAGRQWTGEITITLPFFDHLSGYTAARTQAYALDSADADYTQTQRSARTDWRSARQTLKIAVNSAKSRDTTLVISRKLYQDNLKRFRLGRINADALVVDQKRLLDSELYSVQGWAAAQIAFSKACHALGREIKTCEILIKK